MNKGFTLVELSIVIIIVALIIGGVVAGSNMISQLRLNSVITQVKENTFATFAFRDKYGALPGDFANARAFLGTDCGASDAECNGDGNNVISFTASSVDSEEHRFWHHLFLAGLVNDEFKPENGVNCSPGNNRPLVDSSSNTQGGLQVININDSETNFSFRVALPYNSECNGAFFSSAESLSLDKKFDDGTPALGDVRQSCQICLNNDGAQCYQFSSNTFLNLDFQGKMCVVRIYPTVTN